MKSAPFLLAFLAAAWGNPLFSAQNRAYRIAVIPFESANPHLSGVVFSDCFTVEILQRARRFQVIERKDLMKILEEQKLTLTGITGQEKFSRLGSILGVDALLIGSVHDLETLHGSGGSISVMIKLMEVSTGKVLWADRRKVSHASWSVRELAEIADALAEKTARKMVRKMENSLSPGAFAREGGTAAYREARVRAGDRRVKRQ